MYIYKCIFIIKFFQNVIETSIWENQINPSLHGICIYVWCDCRQRVREQIEKDKRDRAAKVKSW